MEKSVTNDPEPGPGGPVFGSVFPLAAASPGDRLRITALRAGKGLTRRLADLGLPVGCEIEVVFRQGNGRLVVARDMGRVALGAGMADRILVTPADGAI